MPSVRSRFVCEAAIEVPGEAKIRQRGRLVNDRLGLACENGLAHRGRVEQIERDRLRAERPHALGVSRRPERADHLVASVHKLGDEPGADRTARPATKTRIRFSFSLVTSPGYSGGYSYDTTRRTDVTDG